MPDPRLDVGKPRAIARVAPLASKDRHIYATLKRGMHRDAYELLASGAMA